MLLYRVCACVCLPISTSHFKSLFEILIFCSPFHAMCPLFTHFFFALFIYAVIFHFSIYGGISYRITLSLKVKRRYQVTNVEVYFPCSINGKILNERKDDSVTTIGNKKERKKLAFSPWWQREKERQSRWCTKGIKKCLILYIK